MPNNVVSIAVYFLAGIIFLWKTLPQIPMASQATVDTTVSLSFMVQTLVYCQDEDVWQAATYLPIVLG